MQKKELYFTKNFYQGKIFLEPTASNKEMIVNEIKKGILGKGDFQENEEYINTFQTQWGLFNFNVEPTEDGFTITGGSKASFQFYFLSVLLFFLLIIGMLIPVIALGNHAKKIKNVLEATAEKLTDQTTSQNRAAQSEQSCSSEIERLFELKKSGAINNEEFDSLKRKLIS